MIFAPCKSEPDICIIENKNIYEYIGVYVYYLIISATNSEYITNILIENYKFKLKGT